MSRQLGIDPRVIDEWPASLLMEFQELEKLDPSGPWRDNWHAALVAQILANVNRKAGSQVIRVGDFMYRDAESVRQQNDEEMLAKLRILKTNGSSKIHRTP